MLPLCIMNIEDDNDRRFVAELYIRYQSAMYRKAWGILKDDSYAEEALHDAMLKVIRYLDRVRAVPREELLPYLLIIAQTAAINLYNKVRRDRNAALGYGSDWAESLPDDGDCIEGLLIRQEQADLLKECLKMLPQREIDLLNYYYTLELPPKEIARMTGLTPENVRKIISRAKKKVLENYSLKGGKSHE